MAASKRVSYINCNDDIITCEHCGWSDSRGHLCSVNDVPIDTFPKNYSQADYYNVCPECYNIIREEKG